MELGGLQAAALADLLKPQDEESDSDEDQVCGLSLVHSLAFSQQCTFILFSSFYWNTSLNVKIINLHGNKVHRRNLLCIILILQPHVSGVLFHDNNRNLLFLATEYVLIFSAQPSSSVNQFNPGNIGPTKSASTKINGKFTNGVFISGFIFLYSITI